MSKSNSPVPPPQDWRPLLVVLLGGAILVVTGLIVATVAARDGSVPADLPPRLLGGFLLTMVFGVTGIMLAVLGFKAFDWLSPHIDFQKELAEKQNVAVAVLAAAIVLGICYIIAAVAS